MNITVDVAESKDPATPASAAIRNLRAGNPNFGSKPARLLGEQKLGRTAKIENRK
jgi:hypothetical protein